MMMDEQDRLEVLAEMAGLSIDPAYHSGVAQNLRILLAQGDLLNDPPLAAEVEPATAYRP
jgi:hypothetical protein